MGSSCDGQVCFATEWSNGSAINLGGLPGQVGSGANAINEAGQVVGSSYVPGLGARPTEWSNGSVIDLGGLPGSFTSYAYDINDLGQAVGVSEVAGVEYAVEWSNGSLINLGPGVAYGINNYGQVVGASNHEAVEWSHGSMTRLPLPSNYMFSVAGAINDAGQIVGTGWAATAAPEPSAFVLTLLGLAGLGLIGRRSMRTAN